MQKKNIVVNVQEIWWGIRLRDANTLMGYQMELADFIEDLNERATENQNFIEEIEALEELDEPTTKILLNAYKRQLRYVSKMVEYNKKLFTVQKSLMEM